MTYVKPALTTQQVQDQPGTHEPHLKLKMKKQANQLNRAWRDGSIGKGIWAKPHHLSSMSRTHRVEKEANSPNLSSDLCRHTNKQTNKCHLKKKSQCIF